MIRMLALIVAAGLLAGAEPDGCLAITLDGALPRGERRLPLVLDLVRRGGAWETAAWAASPMYNRAQHEVTVTASDDRAGTLTIAVVVSPDAWVGGGEATYQLSLVDAGGSFRGTALGQAVAGALAITRTPLWPTLVPVVIPAAGDHPRLLLRRSDLPALRAQAATPLGQALLARLGAWLQAGADKTYNSAGLSYNAGYGGACHAMRWLITGDPADAQRARELTAETMEATTAKHETGGYASFIHGVALSYDLAYDAWDEDFRRDVARWLWTYADSITRLDKDLRQAKEPIIKGGLGATSNGLTIFRTVAGLGALAIAGEPGEYPPQPRAQRVIDIPAPAQPGAAPEWTYADDTLPSGWIVAGPFDLAGPDPFNALPAAGPALGAAVSGGAFAPLDAAFVISAEGQPDAIDLLAAAGDRLGTRSAYAVTLVVDAPRVVRVHTGYSGAHLRIAGVVVRDRDVLRLPAGRLPLLIVAEAIIAPPAGRLTMAPRFVTVADPELALRAWQRGHAAWQASGRTWPNMERAITICERQVREFSRASIGDRAWDLGDCGDWGDNGHSVAAFQSLAFAQSVRALRGRDLVSGTNLEWILPLAIARGDVKTARASWYGAPPAWSGLARWNLEANADQMTISDLPHALAALIALAEVAPTAPASPPLPLTIADSVKGGFLFRNSYTTDAIHAVFEGRCGASDNVRGGGDFAIAGLGAGWRWARRYQVGDINHSPSRPMCNVVRLPGAVVSGPGRTLAQWQAADGSGGATVVLERWCTGLDTDPRYGDKYTDRTDLGIAALRAFTADYSGVGGAPGVFAVADRISGATGRQPLWVLHADATVTGPRTFTVAHADGASLVGTVVAPATPTLETAKGKKGELHLSGGSEFLVVFTLQRGPAPVVAWTGDGLDARITVGARTLRFDGSRFQSD